jgi:tripartite-type tricarboxylate transporter receptor subunit TctC
MPVRAAIASVFVAASLSAGLLPGSAQAQTPLRVLSGFPPGGAVDALARVFGDRLAESLGRAVVVENRTGAGGQIAIDALRGAAADGNTLLVAADANISVYPHTVRNPTYDPRTDLTPIAHLGRYDIGLAVGQAVSAPDLKAWLAWVREDPARGSYGSASAGSPLHFLGLMLSSASGVPLTHVPYRGVGPALADATGGQVPAVILPLGTMSQQVRAGKIRVLAIAGARRSAVAPEVPTLVESGYPGLQVDGWFGLFAPAGLPPAMVARLNDLVQQAGRHPTVRERMRALDLEFRDMSATEFRNFVVADLDRWGPVIRASGFSADSH